MGLHEVSLSLKKKNHKSLLLLYDALSSFYQKQFLFGIISIYHYGGIFIRSDAAFQIQLFEMNRKNYIFKEKTKKNNNNKHSFYSNTLYVLQNHSDTTVVSSLEFLIGTPRHPILLDFINKL